MLLVVTSVVLEVAALGLNVYGYYLFSECTNWVNIVTSVLLVIMPAVQCLHFNRQNSLLTTACVSLYVSYLSLISQFSEEKCGMLDVKSMGADIGTSTILFFISMYGSVMGGGTFKK